MEGQDATPQAERPSAKAPADPQIMARLLRIERRAARQGTRERKCAYGAVQLGKELRWVKEEQVYTKVDCASYDDWVKSRVRLEHSQAAVYCAVAPLPLRLLRGRALSLGRLQIIVKAPAWQWPVLCKHGHQPSSEARLRAAVRGGEEHLLAHQDQAQARLHVKAVLEGAEPFRRSRKQVPLDEAVDALAGALKEVKRAARALGELKDLAGQKAKGGPWVARLIKAAAVADGEVQAVVQRFRIPESEENFKEDKDFGGKKGRAEGREAPPQRRAAEAPAPSVKPAPPPRDPASTVSAPVAADPPHAVSAPVVSEPPVAESAPVASKPLAAMSPSADEPPTAADAAMTDEPPTVASAPETDEPPPAPPSTVRITDVCAALARELSLLEQQRLSAALVGLLLDGVGAQVLATARAEVTALCDKARCAEGPGGLPATSLSSLCAALLLDPLEQRWPVVFAVFSDDALAKTRPALDLIDPDRVPPGYQESLRAAQVRHRPPPQHRSDAERDAALARLGGLIADKRAQILLERKQRRPY